MKFKPQYYGLYKTTNSTASKLILTEPQDDSIFPPGISYQDNAFSLDRIYMVTSSSQQKFLVDHFSNQGVELDINWK